MRALAKSGAGEIKARGLREMRARMEKNPIRAMGAVIVVLGAALLIQGCDVAPKYVRPSVQTPASYKEVTPADTRSMDGWKVAEPKDATLHGNWWEVFGDPELNSLEQEVSISNQNVAAAFANFMAARAIVWEAHSLYYPTVTTSPSILREYVPATSVNSTAGAAGNNFASFSLPFDATWTPDLWGRVRNTVRANAYTAQADAADLENTRLTAQAELAVDYCSLRGQDSLKQLLDSTVVAYQQSLDLTKALYETGIDSAEAVGQAETLLDATRAQATNLGIARAQYEHAIALLVGQPASTFSIPVEPLTAPPPAIPFGVPSQILERRPDIAASERLMASANALIGVQKAAYYPTITLSAAAGLESTSITKWFTWPSRFFSMGPTATETLFDAGLRHATVLQYRYQYDSTVATYRQTVLTAFQQVEDNLAALRILSLEIKQQDDAVKAAQNVLTLATDRYKLGIDPYLNVIAAETMLLSNQQTAVDLRITQITSSVQLIEALGGGWDTSQLPTPQQVSSHQENVMPIPPPPGALNPSVPPPSAPNPTPLPSQ
jgi:NodT family efflux transporter outer membrane factor (OMF) lipoprotein